ncbi:uncharacterized protein IWZ02DRAFT_256570 [Phyllosticta citriasiana]|uniref:uncharacterized protein n=1 Tax=Phyllosticta citriasiana TaxID=595635 RepID=UPI0030FD496F
MVLSLVVILRYQRLFEATMVRSILWRKTVGPSSQSPERMLGPFWYRNMYVNGTANLSTMSKFIEGITLAMTTQIRQTPGFIETSPFEQGITWDTVTCVKVRWLWLLYPASLLCFTVVFLSLAIFQIRKSRQPWQSDWKSSSLALLFHGLEASTRDAHGSVPRQKYMAKAADQIHVQLLRGESGWMFSGSSRPEDQEGTLEAKSSEEFCPNDSPDNQRRPSLRVSRTSTTSLLVSPGAYGSASLTPRSQSRQPSPIRSSTI